MISLSRNTPTALIVGVAGFLGSHLAEKLLAKKIQVVGVDDLSTGKKGNLIDAAKDKNFYFINQPIQETSQLQTQRTDYAYFILNEELNPGLFLSALDKFLELCRGYLTAEGKPRIVLLSSIELYENQLRLRNLKTAENKLAEFITENKANARVVRLGPVFGPRMNFREEDPLIKLLIDAARGEIHKKETVLDFMSRALFIDDAVELLLKATLHGGTAQQIYDGVLLEPVKISEVKQVLLDPLWHESQNFTPTKLPPWLTPNLLKTKNELSWRPKTNLVKALKTTLTYLKENSQLIPEEKKEAVAGKEAPKDPVGSELKVEPLKVRKVNINLEGIKKSLGLYLGIILISLALVYPVLDLLIGGLSIRAHLKNMGYAIREGDLKRAENEANYAYLGVKRVSEFADSLSIVKATGVFRPEFESLAKLTLILEDTTTASLETVRGVKYLSEGLKRVSGESGVEVGDQFNNAQIKFHNAQSLFAASQARLAAADTKPFFLPLIKPRIDDLRLKIGYYQALADTSYSLSLLLPKLVAVEGKKSYLVLLQDNRDLKPGGGVLVAFCQLFFETGRLVATKCGGVDDLDQSLSDSVPAPNDLKTELNGSEWNLKNSNLEVDSPANAKWAQWFYNKETGSLVNGVLTWDITALSELLEVVGGLKLPGRYATVESGNLYDLTQSYNNDSQFLPTVQKELINKLFFASDKNWFKVGASLGRSLKGKDILVYLSDPVFFSYLNSLGWSGTFPRKTAEKVGERDEFLAVFENNLSHNLANQTIQRKYLLESNLNEKGELFHKLTLGYTLGDSQGNASSGYKFKIKVFLASGSKLKKAVFKGVDITSAFESFSDFGRSLYSTRLELKDKESADLILEYQDLKAVEFTEGQIKVRLNVVKQPGTNKDSFDWRFKHPNNIKSSIDNDFVTDLSQDRSFEINLKN